MGRKAVGYGRQRAALLGGVVGFLLCVIALTAAVALNGGGVASVGAGLLVGGFSGIPFGAMLAVMWYSRTDQEG